MNGNMHWHRVKRISLTAQKAITTTGSDEAGRRAKGERGGEAER